MKVLLINNQFKIGGAARVAAVMCNGFFENGEDMYVLTDDKFSDFQYELDKGIEIKSLLRKDYRKRKGHLSKSLKAIHIIRNIRRVIKEIRPDVIIAIQADMYLRALIARGGIRIPLIAADHSTITHKYDIVTNLTRSHLYCFADGLSILTEKDKKLLGNKFPKKEVIYNPLSFSVSDSETVRRKNILCVGRLDSWKVKGIDIILDIWASISDKYPDWTLEIAGSGTPDSVALISDLANKKGIKNRYRLLGLVKNMKELYQETSIFALPSRIEGFPMVLMEAMSQGCPSVAFRIQGSTEEMVEEGSGLVIEDGDVDGFRSGLSSLIESDVLREEMSKKAIHSVERFSQESFINHWMMYIKQVIEHYG